MAWAADAEDLQRLASLVRCWRLPGDRLASLVGAERRTLLCKWKKLSAGVLFFCTPDDVDVDVLANLEQLVEKELSWIDIHCCPDMIARNICQAFA